MGHSAYNLHDAWHTGQFMNESKGRTDVRQTLDRYQPPQPPTLEAGVLDSEPAVGASHLIYCPLVQIPIIALKLASLVRGRGVQLACGGPLDPHNGGQRTVCKLEAPQGALGACGGHMQIRSHCIPAPFARATDSPVSPQV